MILQNFTPLEPIFIKVPKQDDIQLRRKGNILETEYINKYAKPFCSVWYHKSAETKQYLVTCWRKAVAKNGQVCGKYTCLIMKLFSILKFFTKAQLNYVQHRPFPWLCP
jgi:hypothetical protein